MTKTWFYVLFALFLIIAILKPLIKQQLDYNRFLALSRQTEPNHHLIMQPRPVPFVGDLLRIRKALESDDVYGGALQQMISKKAKMMLNFFALQPTLMIYDPATAKELLSAENWDKTEQNVVVYALFNAVSPGSMITLSGDEQIERHRIITPVFSKIRMLNYSKIMAETVDLAMRKAASASRDQHLGLKSNDDPIQMFEGAEIDFVKLFKRWTFDILGRCAFGMDEVGDDIVNAFTEMERLAQNFSTCPTILFKWLSWIPIKTKRDLDRAVKVVRSYVSTVINRRREIIKQSGSRKDLFIDILLEHRDKNGVGLTDDQICADSILLMIGGHDTSAVLCAWLMSLFAREPDNQIMDRCRREIDDVLGGPGSNRIPTRDDIGKMRYLQAVILEALRLHPPAPAVGRTVSEDIKLNGLTLEKGNNVYVDVRNLHRHPDLYDDPETFDPERFLERDTDGNITRVLKLPRAKQNTDDAAASSSSETVNMFAYLPFSTGRRKCPGQDFALTESPIIIAMILHRYEIEFQPGQIFPEGIEVVSVPKYGVMGRLTRRRADSSSPAAEYK